MQGTWNFMGKYKNIETGIEKLCLECNQSFRVYPYLIRLGYGKFCSRICRSKYRSRTPEDKKRWRMAALLGSEKTKGVNHHSWKGGVSTESEKMRKSNLSKEWRKNVFTRDKYTCVECGYKGKNLHPHHIKSFSEFSEERFNISNGMTLCGECHRLKHKDDARIWGSWAKRDNRD